MAVPVVINWGVSSFYGWGVYGLNLALQWAGDPDIAAASPMPILEDEFVVEPDQLAALTPFGQRSAALQAWLTGLPPGPARVAGPVLDALHHSFEPIHSRPDAPLVGRPNIGVVFFQDTVLEPEAIERARRYPVIVAGSTWNARLMQAQGIGNVRTVLQGVDPSRFHPGPRQGRFGDRFVVFSGGKLERRKGQDIVLAAFARFAQGRPDALLATAWRSPWTDDALTKAAVPSSQVLDLGAVPNPLLPAVLREMDVALFPNRAEGGTNLVAMEAMACGVPAILSRNTGHLDLIEEGNCYTLDRQAPLAGPEGAVAGVEGWGECDVDEVVARLEEVYADREAARARGLRGAETMRRLTWGETARQMKALVLELA